MPHLNIFKCPEYIKIRFALKTRMTNLHFFTNRIQYSKVIWKGKISNYKFQEEIYKNSLSVFNQHAKEKPDEWTVAVL